MYKISKKLGVVMAAASAALLAVVGVTASGASATPAAAPAGGGSVVQSVSAGSTTSVAVNGLRLRAEPGRGGWVKGLLYKGDRVFIKETFHPSYKSASWVGVVLKQRSKGGLPKLTRGYVYKAYLR
ncbi:hypothetical protein [Streptomyces sp. NPDC002402]